MSPAGASTLGSMRATTRYPARLAKPPPAPRYSPAQPGGPQKAKTHCNPYLPWLRDGPAAGSPNDHCRVFADPAEHPFCLSLQAEAGELDLRAGAGVTLSESAADRHQHAKRKNDPVSRIFITGSTDGLGRAAASVLMGAGHDVVLHARTIERAAALGDLAPDAAGVVIGDLSSAAETRELADQVNDIGRMDAVIHNAGVFLEPSRSATAEGHAKTLAVNTLAPYMLTALID